MHGVAHGVCGEGVEGSPRAHILLKALYHCPIGSDKTQHEIKRISTFKR